MTDEISGSEETMKQITEDTAQKIDAAAVREQPVGQPTGEYYHNLEILEDVDHPEVPREHADGYFFRTMGPGRLSTVTDVKVMTSSMSDSDYSTLLTGLHGVGKDKLTLHCCAKTNRATIRVVGNDDDDFIDILVGGYKPDGNGGFEHRKGLLTIAIEYGYVFIMDEFNSLSGKVQTQLNMMLESSDQKQLVIPETNEVITPHPQFRFVGTQNPNQIGYAGREVLDGATSSRFFPIEIPPLQEDAEKNVVAGQTFYDANSDDLDKLIGETGVITELRKLYHSGTITKWISTRDVIQIGRRAEDLGNTAIAAEILLNARVDPEDQDAVMTKMDDTKW